MQLYSLLCIFLGWCPDQILILDAFYHSFRIRKKNEEFLLRAWVEIFVLLFQEFSIKLLSVKFGVSLARKTILLQHGFCTFFLVFLFSSIF